MAQMKLKIVTPDKLAFDGDAERVIVRTLTGDVAILPNHAEISTALGVGVAKVMCGGKTRKAALNGGVMTVVDNTVSILTVTFEWEDEIDIERAKIAESKARNALAGAKSGDKEHAVLEAKLKRALARLQTKAE
ncbi:MAG: ATP synthase F1 subunit epsilon [Clostridia bacterium]|nr:ATP synthase F1 subunit epsilon [Clostridia bacterium]